MSDIIFNIILVVISIIICMVVLWPVIKLLTKYEVKSNNKIHADTSYVFCEDLFFVETDKYTTEINKIIIDNISSKLNCKSMLEQHGQDLANVILSDNFREWKSIKKIGYLKFELDLLQGPTDSLSRDISNKNRFRTYLKLKNGNPTASEIKQELRHTIHNKFNQSYEIIHIKAVDDKIIKIFGVVVVIDIFMVGIMIFTLWQY